MHDLTILLADDNQVDRLVLSRMVKSLGANVVEVSNGAEAVAAMQSVKPDIVLMDVMMPVMDGRQAARMIKQQAGEEFIPLIFLTSLTDADNLAECLDSGGDDFLSKPYNATVIAAKIRSFARMRLMHKTVQQQRDTIIEHNQYMLREQQVAKAVFYNVAHAGCLNAPNIRYELAPMAVFNGDVLLAAYSPSGDMYVVVGDFTGHGLAAAIGAMPLAEVFYSMTERGYTLRDVIRAMNKRLKEILPVGFFCCAAVAGINFAHRTLSLWLGGLPDCYLIKTNGDVETLTSNRLPLGVVSDANFNDYMLEMPMAVGERLFIFSDGIVEANNPAGDMFGYERVAAICRQGGDIFNNLQQQVDAFSGDAERSDDITLIELTMPEHGPELNELEQQVASIGPRTWSMTYRLEADTLKQFDPHALLISIITEVPGLRVLSSQIRMILTELYVNALEHGILQLSSKLKASPEGFCQYYQERGERLANLTQGYIEVRLHHTSDGARGDLILEVEDSGAGFDYQTKSTNPNEKNIYSGRGIDLVQQLCSSLSYHGRGNIVRAEIAWPKKING